MGKIGVQGICYDAGSSYLRGPAGAPPRIREALFSGAMNLYTEKGADLSGRFEDVGDFVIRDYFDIEAHTREQLQKGRKVFTLGGDHSITYPILRAYHKRYPRLDILQIDAHPDLYEVYDGDPHSHACPFARIMGEGIASRLVQIGIRTLNPHQQEQASRFGVEVHTMREGIPVDGLSFSNPVYISLDLDALDPAFAPGVSHREAGGLSSREVIGLLQGLRGEVVGADLVEYNPGQDLGRVTASLAAKLMKELLGKLL